MKKSYCKPDLNLFELALIQNILDGSPANNGNSPVTPTPGGGGTENPEIAPARQLYI